MNEMPGAAVVMILKQLLPEHLTTGAQNYAVASELASRRFCARWPSAF
jgi:hypothetical protein